MATTTADTMMMMPTSTASIPNATTNNNGDESGAADTDDEQNESKARVICQQARSLWLAATCPEDLMQVETLYRQVWEQQDDDDKQDSKRRRRLLNATTSASTAIGTTGDDIMSCTRQQAGERLAMLLLQSGRTRQADDMLKQCLSFVKCRLSTQILAYSSTIQAFHTNAGNNTNHKSNSGDADIPCRIYDNFLSMRELDFLQRIFQDSSSSYWTSHNYAVEPPSLYFSHVLPLESDILEKDYGALGTIVRRIQTILTTTTSTIGEMEEGGDEDIKATTNSSHNTTATKPFAPLVQRCTHVEMWAHNRPHATGHQLHFDSENEGQGDRIRHPVVSCILYLSESASTSTSSSSSSMSPPSLITNQRRVSHRAADKGWLIEPKLRRLAVFDGRVLHGVLPGQGVLPSSSSTSSPSRRITLMLAFWRYIQVRSTPQPSLSSSASSVDQAAADTTTTTTTTTPRSRGGAAQPFPLNPKPDEHSAISQDGDSSCWAWQLRQPLPPPPALSPDDEAKISSTSATSKPTLADPIPLDHVYETLDGQPWTHKLGMPEYNEVFQGF